MRLPLRRAVNKMTTDDPGLIFGALVACSAMKYLSLYLLEIGENKKYSLVGRVAALYMYPVKSCRGIQLTEADCTSLGLSCFGICDRHWAIADANGTCLTQRQEPRMALIRVTVKGGELVLNAPHMPAVTLPIDLPFTSSTLSTIRVKADTVPTVDCGNEVATWITRYLNRPKLRLHYAAPSLKKRCCAHAQKNWNHPATEKDMVALSDYCGYMLCTNPSLAELNKRLPTAVPIDNFRANIVVDECEAFAEDHWVSVRVGNAQLRALDACTRCVLTTVDQELGVRDLEEEPLATLKKFRLKHPYGQKPVFGVNLTLDKPGKIRVGDPVYANIGQLNVSDLS